jgi:hypothetical protein
MRLQTGTDVGRVWLVALSVFVLSVVVVRSLGRNADVRMRALGIGYVGLFALVAALVVSTWWNLRVGPTSVVLRAVIFVALAVGYLLLLIALIFPFL